MTFSVKVIRESFNKTRPISDRVTEMFYKNLFQDHPEAKGLFHNVDFPKQQQLLYNSLDFVVTNLDNPERLSEYLQNLGERHVSYGTEKEHFDWVGKALLETFAHFFGDEWTEELAENWTNAFKTIADYMGIGMRAKLNNVNNVVPMTEEPTPNLSAHNNVGDLSITLPQSVKDEIRKAVAQAVQTAIQQEVENALAEEINKVASPEQITKIMEALKGAA